MDDGGVDAGSTSMCDGRPTDAPTTRGEAAGVLDATHGRILVYGGNQAAPVMCSPAYDLVSDVWAFHLDCNNWEPIAAAGGPGVRARHAMTLDTMRERAIVFGGRNRLGFGSYEYFNDVWAFDFATDTWSEIATTGTAPSPRAETVIAYDEAKDRLLVFGGDIDTMGLLQGIGDMFALDLATGTWSEITAAGAPEPRLYHGGTVVGNELVTFGGTAGFSPPYFNDVYAFDLTSDTWRTVSSGGGPRPRFGADVIGDPANDRAFIAFGHDDGDLANENDVWAINLTSGAWTAIHPGDTLNGAPSGPCMFPADFTIPDEGSPERRYSMVTTQDGTTAYVTGGKTDCGNINDVWALDLATAEWTSLRPPTGGEACNRSGRTSCTTLCF